MLKIGGRILVSVAGMAAFLAISAASAFACIGLPLSNYNYAQSDPVYGGTFKGYSTVQYDSVYDEFVYKAASAYDVNTTLVINQLDTNVIGEDECLDQYYNCERDGYTGSAHNTAYNYPNTTNLYASYEKGYTTCTDPSGYHEYVATGTHSFTINGSTTTGNSEYYN